MKSHRNTAIGKIKHGIRILVLLLGMGLCFYPLIAGIIDKSKQKSVIATYQSEMQDAQDPEVPSSGVLGIIEIPKIDVKLPIYHGTGEDVLSVGVGHLEGTSLPVGGESTHSVITGHRGLPNAKLFTRLDEIEVGDLFFIEICNEELTYEVSEIKVISPKETEVLNIQEGRDLVSLLTCTPYGINSHRLVVTGERCEYQEEVKIGIKQQMPSVREIIFAVLPFFLMVTVIINQVCRNSVRRKEKKNDENMQ